MALYSIGNLSFVVLHSESGPDCPPEVLTEQCQPITRPGVDGAGVMRLGKQGKPFTMLSGVDVAGASGILSTRVAYESLIGFGAQNIVWSSIDYASDFLTQYFVLAVTITRTKKLSVISGGITAGSDTWVEAKWMLLPTVAQ